MPKKSADPKLCHDSKQLALIIHNFLLDQRYNKKCLSKQSRRKIDVATDCLKKAYKIRMTDYILLKVLVPLEEIYKVGYRPTPVRSRIAAESHKRKGNELMDSGLFSLAEREYTEALRLYPRNAIYHCNRAASRVRQGQLEEAVVDCNVALQLDRNYAKAYCWLGLTHALMEQPARAIRCYRKALRIDPDNPACSANLDLISRRMNRVTFRVLEPICRYSRALLARLLENAFGRKPREEAGARPLADTSKGSNAKIIDNAVARRSQEDADTRPLTNSSKRSSEKISDYHIGKLD